MGAKLAALPKMAAFYGVWYPTRWLGWGWWPRYAAHGALAGHLRFAERHSRKLAREVFHGMLVHQAKLERKQVFLARLVDVANELFAMAACVSRASALAADRSPHAAEARELADLFCRGSRRRIKRLFADLWHNDDDRKYRTARRVLDGHHQWLEEGLVEGRKDSGT